ncbi:MAG: 1-acyl-sn-glycerol-3-phosphate acyltransferase [Bacteroidales bacterium]|nr:1-acyl-sn-glycerol-3-phosphate acyltransferase [Bacteroidales bacterium]
MILKATHHPVIYPFFSLYTRLKIQRHFHKVHITGTHTEKHLPVFLISNHISWWDGFWAMYLNLKLFHRKFFFMMLEEQLKRHIYFNKTGGYSVRKGSKTIVETLNYTAELLADPGNIVLIFPTGEIESMHKQVHHFEKGVEYILKKVKNEIQIIFLVNLVDYFSNQKPGLYMFIKEHTGKDFRSDILQEEYDRFYIQCVSSNISKGGEA